jgi:hypothetical protein
MIIIEVAIELLIFVILRHIILLAFHDDRMLVRRYIDGFIEAFSRDKK